MENDDLILTSMVLVKNMEDFIKKCEVSKVTDEQWFIDFEIKMSNLSTKDHNLNY